jgi:hypothetical protein
MQLLLASLGLPADPLISSLQLQRQDAEPQAPEPALFRANQVAHLGAHQRTRPRGYSWIINSFQIPPRYHSLPGSAQVPESGRRLKAAAGGLLQAL